MPINTVPQDAPDGGSLNRLLLRLDSDLPRAAEKYEELRRVLIKFFEWNRSPRADDLADEVISRLAMKAVDDIQNIKAFARKIAEYVLMEEAKKSQRLTSIDEMTHEIPSVETSPDTIVEKLDAKIRIDCLRMCREQLLPEEDALVMAYHDVEHESHKLCRKRLAQQMGLTMNALRVRANRLRDKLEDCVSMRLEERRRNFARAGGSGGPALHT